MYIYINILILKGHRGIASRNIHATRQWRRSSPTSSSTRAGWVLSVMPSWRAATIPCFLPGSFLRPELIGISLCKSTIWIHFVFCVMFFIKMLKKHVVGGLYIYMIYSYIVYNIHIWIRCHRMAMAGGNLVALCRWKRCD